MELTTIGAKLADFWAHAGVEEPNYPVDTGAVLQLLDAAGYVVAGDDLLQWCNQGTLVVPLVAGNRARGPEQCWAALMQCEGRRRWKPFHRLHHFKATTAERILWECEAAGAKKPINDLDTVDLEMLLIMMEGAEQRYVRNLLRLAIQQKLREDT